MNTIFDEIQKEREYQIIKWGNDFDDKSTINDWISYIVRYAGDAGFIDFSPEEQRKYLIKVAALSVAAIEAFDRNEGFPPRHYDNRDR